MPSKVPCYLRTLRREWGLTQSELARLVPQCRRSRVSEVERAIAPPNARELLAYALIFERGPHEIFPRYAGEIADAIRRGTPELDRVLAKGRSPSAARKAEFLKRLNNRGQLPAHHHSHS